MNEDAATMPLTQKIKALRQIQFALGPEQHKLARACGITQHEFATLVNEELIEVTYFQDDGEDLDRHHIESILPAGIALLSQAHVSSPDPLPIILVTPQKSAWQRIYPGMVKALWDLIKIAVGAGLGYWFAKKSGH